MATNNMEVKITLIPLEQDETQNHRTITITVHNLSVRVGRASKNPSKGLLAAPDNAWFDYPILSRTHAKFTASLNQQEIYLQDCGSTHGTYIDKQRLETGVEFAVADGEVITFGQRVTSGAVTYPAKDFRVHSKWESRSEVQDSYSTTIMTTQRLVNTASISRPAFTNDFEHSSEPSREGSVQIAAPHRHSFSVPSSDDEVDTEDEEEEVQIASSIQGGEEEISAATTPDRQAVGKAYNDTEGEARGSKTGKAPGETRGLNLKGPSLQDLLTKSAKDGTSQANPINLEGVYTDIIDVDTESEDDGPDVLPFSESTKADQPNRSKVWDEPQVGHQPYTVTMPTTMAVAEEQGDQNAKIQRHCIVPETQANVANEDEARGQEPGNVVAESTAGATDGFDSDDDDEFDYDHEFLADEDLDPFPEPTVLNYGKPNTSKPKVTFQVGSEKPHYKTLTPPFDEFRPIRLGHLSASDAIDVSQPTEPPSAWAQRAPSPSDAALARKASDPKTSLGRDIFDNFYVPPWPAAAKTTHSHSTEHAADTAAAREEHNGALSWPELQSPEPRLYDQGPFSSQPKVVIPVACAPKPDNVKDQSKKATVTWADPHEKNDTRIMITDCFAYTGKQASKITIPSLVEDYLAENPRSFKRKYGGMNGSNDVEDAPNAPNQSTPIIRTSGYKRTFAEANPVVSSYSLENELSGTKWRSPTDFTWDSGEANTTQGQLGLIDRDTPLPDAQPRENIFQTPNASISQDSVAEPAASSVLITKTGHGEGTEEPARKKARISSSSSGGIGKFVMGVGFGLLGAAAAFIATIPASVYEEALRELGNVA